MLRDRRARSPARRSSQIEYSNFGYALLGRIVTNVSGRPYKDYIEQRSCARSAWLRPATTIVDVAAGRAARSAIAGRMRPGRASRTCAHGAFGAMGGVQTSASDYARWVAFLLSAWPARDGAGDGAGAPLDGARDGAGAELPAPSSAARAPAAGAVPARRPPTRMGLRVAQDCDLGTALTHGGGYPGYGSFMLLLPEHGVGIFAFANRTYTAPSRPVIEAAMELQRAGLLSPPHRAGQRRAGLDLPRRRRHLRRPGPSSRRGRSAGDELPDGPLAGELGARARWARCANRSDLPDRRADHRHRRPGRPFRLGVRARPAGGPACCSRRPARRPSRRCG